MFDILLIVLLILIPVAMAQLYVYILKNNKFSRCGLLLLSAFMLVTCYMMVLYIGLSITDPSPLKEKIIWLSILYFGLILLGFHSFHANFKISYYKKALNKNVGTDCSFVAEYYPSPIKVLMVSYIYLSVYCALNMAFSILILIVLLKGGEAHNIAIMICCIIAALTGGYLICISFIRLLVKCINCESYVFYIDRELSAFNKIAKRAVKNKVLDCEYCNATYALDSSLDLNQLREEKKKKIQKDNEAKQ